MTRSATFVEKSGVPFLPMSMAKGLLPDTHPQCAGAARSTVLKDSDVVMLIGARLNWLLSHGKGKTWGERRRSSSRSTSSRRRWTPTSRSSRPWSAISAPASRRCSKAWAATGRPPPADWTNAVKTKREENVAKMAPRLMNNNVADGLSRRARRAAHLIKERPDAILVNEGANTLDLARGIIDMYQPRKRLDVGTWGVMGIGMGYAIAAAIETGKPVLAVEGDSAFGFSGMEVETICRYKLPVCIVIFNNDGIYRGTDVNTAGSDPATTVFVKGARYDKMMEAFGGVGVNATSPDELKRAVNAAMDSGKPTLINAVIDPAAGSESGRIGNLNPQSASARRNNRRQPVIPRAEADRHSTGATTMTKALEGVQHPRLHPRPVGTDLHATAGLVRRRRDQGRAPGRRRHHARPAAGHPERGQPLFHDAEPQQALDHARHQEPEGQGGPRRA